MTDEVISEAHRDATRAWKVVEKLYEQFIVSPKIPTSPRRWNQSESEYAHKELDEAEVELRMQMARLCCANARLEEAAEMDESLLRREEFTETVARVADVLNSIHRVERNVGDRRVFIKSQREGVKGSSENHKPNAFLLNECKAEQNVVVRIKEWLAEYYDEYCYHPVTLGIHFSFSVLYCLTQQSIYAYIFLVMKGAIDAKLCVYRIFTSVLWAFFILIVDHLGALNMEPWLVISLAIGAGVGFAGILWWDYKRASLLLEEKYKKR